MHFIFSDTDAGQPSRALPTPQPDLLRIADPRNPHSHIGTIGFYFPGSEESYDKKFGGGFMGNFWDTGRDGISVKPPGNKTRKFFSNAEAAFQALKFWPRVDDFTNASASEAFKKKKYFGVEADFAYAGFKSNWLGMWAVLKSKFRRGSECANKLKDTGDAYLLEHNNKDGKDAIWSNNKVGDGKNWLGLQLMLIRDFNNNKNKSDENTWTYFIRETCGIDTENTGEVKPGQEQKERTWQNLVLEATKAVCKLEGISLDENLLSHPQDLQGEVIGITGISRCGKGWVSEGLLKAIRNSGKKVIVVGEEEFWQDARKVKVRGEMRSSEVEPECIDHVKFAAAIKEHRKTYDIVIAEGCQLLYHPPLTELLNVVFFIELDKVEARRRRTGKRDGKLNPLPLKPEDFDDLLWPVHERYVRDHVKPMKNKGKNIVDVQSPTNEMDCNKIVEQIMSEQGLVRIMDNRTGWLP
jgi:uridine kinase/predicted NAD-dependent protein-ADP-ribosyltransferase YbiA (DUF1768 family)